MFENNARPASGLRRSLRSWALVWVVAPIVGSLWGCAAPVFNQPISISNRTKVGRHVRTLSPVHAEITSYFFVLIPIVPDPRDLYDELLVAARNAGGNAVVDVQIRNSNLFAWLFPGIVVNTIEAQGMAAVLE